MRDSLVAIRHLEAAVTGARWTTGIVLRYGGFYGPGTSMSPGGEQFEMIRKRRFPVVGDGGGMWSCIHVADAAAATVAAVEHGQSGIYNVVDDDPAPVADWLPALAQALGAPKPWRGRFFAAAQDGDLAGLEVLLAREVVLTGDGRGKVPALARSLHGRDRVARTLFSWARLGARIPGAAIRPVQVNGEPGALLLTGDDRLIGVWALEIADGQIHRISSIVNPEKLAHLGPVADLRKLLGSGPAASREQSESRPGPRLSSPPRPGPAGRPETTRSCGIR